jgi:hypothetical protein
VLSAAERNDHGTAAQQTAHEQAYVAWRFVQDVSERRRERPARGGCLEQEEIGVEPDGEPDDVFRLAA